jgi:ribosomal protein S18 acetylase RimI-like enzyme
MNRKLNNTDCEQIVIVHKNAYKDFFLTKLGDSFLKTYYKASINHPDCIKIGYFDDKNELKGFALGTIKSAGYHKNLLKKNILPFSLSFIKILFSNPKALLRLKNNMEKRGKENDNGDYAELLSIAVFQNFKVNGIGKSLLNDFEKRAWDQGCTTVTLTTDKNNNDGVLAFYQNAGYRIFYEFISYPNRPMYKLIKTSN